MKSDLLPFWRSFLRDPRRIGAIAPAGRPLSEAMAREVLAVAHPGIVIELGAGTGSITRALFEIRHRMTELIAVEKTPELAVRLRQKFPGMRIHVHCASEVERLSLPRHSNLTLVSSLPFRSLPDAGQASPEQRDCEDQRNGLPLSTDPVQLLWPPPLSQPDQGSGLATQTHHRAQPAPPRPSGCWNGPDRH